MADSYIGLSGIECDFETFLALLSTSFTACRAGFDYPAELRLEIITA
jgi:hypothetical protein